jgi:hypothetical protein
VHRDGCQQAEILREGFRFRANTIEGAKLFRRRKSLLGTSRMTIRLGILRQIGNVPEDIRVQADEYFFTLAATLADGQILDDALTYYRMHDANGYQLSNGGLPALRNKQKALAALAWHLSDQLNARGIDANAGRAITEIIAAEANQIRLLADGGWPWETVRTEIDIYKVVFAEASAPRWILKILGLIPGLFMPPQTYYRVRQQLGQSAFYNRLRQRWLPFPQAAHVSRTSRTG